MDLKRNVFFFLKIRKRKKRNAFSFKKKEKEKRGILLKGPTSRNDIRVCLKRQEFFLLLKVTTDDLGFLFFSPFSLNRSLTTFNLNMVGSQDYIGGPSYETIYIIFTQTI